MQYLRFVHSVMGGVCHSPGLKSLCTGIMLCIGMLLPVSHALTLEGMVTQEVKLPPQADETGVIGVNFEIPPGSYPFIVEVYPGTPAERVGLRPGDVLISVNARTTKGMTRTQLDLAISDVPGEVVRFVVYRNGQTRPVQLTVAPLSSVWPQAVRQLYQP